MNISNIPGPGDVATWPVMPADDDSPWITDARDHLLACVDDWALWLADCEGWPGEGMAAIIGPHHPQRPYPDYSAWVYDVA